MIILKRPLTLQTARSTVSSPAMNTWSTSLPVLTKGSAVRFLCEYTGIPLCNTIAAGDAENDISMIRAAHIGCAMKNAEEEVKQAADYITENDNNHDGVAEIIHKFVLK